MQDQDSEEFRKDEDKSTQSSQDPLLEILSPIAKKRSGEIPNSIKRYRIKRLLGQGAFGQVFLGHDDQLQRDVAIKVPNSAFLKDSNRTADYLNEARTIAGLDHPNIVPVYDVGSTFDFPIYIVTKYIQGQSLSDLIKKSPLAIDEIINLVATVAKALHFAHRKGVVHRDVKPENILIEESGKPYLVDLGLALSENIIAPESGVIGTPAYMSPEQARGEGHRVDGRTDIYSLGIVLYELLAGRRPFSAPSSKELLEKVADSEPKPLRQVNDSIPKELERICLKAIARLAKERYTTARDFAEDLEDFWAETSSWEHQTPRQEPGLDSGNQPSSKHRTRREQSTAAPGQEPQPKVLPKGALAFDGHDADFFLKLLPGPFDRHDVPESIHFWKKGIESRENAFSVGLIYGPSGSGKSSFLQAGLLPRVDDSIQTVFLPATSTNTEASLHRMLLRLHPECPAQLSLVDLLKRLRRGDGDRHGKKTLIVIDQFEQWLAHWIHRPEFHRTELVQALRQCDGIHLQCLLTIRDDFWMAITDFFSQLEVDLVNGKNTRCIERFDLKHAQHVLHQFGVAYEKLPADYHELDDSQIAFLKSAVSEFAVDGRVACVAISLLAEMLKHSEWTCETIQEIGGIQGLGLAYLEECFHGGQAPPQNRLHEQAVRKVLQAMLPQEDANIKGTAINRKRLAEVADYPQDSKELKQLLQVLEKRLITATETPIGISEQREVSYQLAHDFFVPAIRDWILTSQQRTPRGRAEVLLEQRARNWQFKPENQRLPGPGEFAHFVWYTSNSKKSKRSQGMMRAAWRYYFTRFSIFAFAVTLLGISANWFYNDLTQKQIRSKAETLVASLYAAPDDAIPYVLENLDANSVTESILLQDFETTENPQERFRAAIGLADANILKVEFLLDRLANASPNEAQHIARAVFNNSNNEFEEKLRQRISDTKDLSVKTRYELLLGDLTSLDTLAQSLELRPDSSHRSQLIANFSLWNHDWNAVRSFFEITENRDLLTGLIQAMSLVEPDRIEDSVRIQLINQVQKHYRNCPDALVHSSCKSFLKKWGTEVPSLTSESLPANATWKETSTGLTLIRIKAGTYMREILDRGKYPVTIEDDFWMSDVEINSRLFWKYASDPDLAPDHRPIEMSHFNVMYSPEGRAREIEGPYTSEHPIHRIHLNDAIRFCNWLSAQEGLEPVYIQGKKIAKQSYDAGSYSEKNFYEWTIDFSANGYRMPGFFEFAYARNGGSTQRFPFGNDYRLAKHFCVFSSSGTNWILGSCEKSASRLPNPFGLFDICGNLGEFSHTCEIDSKKIIPKVESIAPHRMNWETKDINYATNYLPGINRAPAFYGKGGFRVVRKAAN